MANFDKETAEFASIYISNMVPAMVMQALFDINRQFLNTFSKTKVVMCLQIATTTLHYFWNQIFVLHLNLGVKGTCYASSVTMLINLLLITMISCYI